MKVELKEIGGEVLRSHERKQFEVTIKDSTIRDRILMVDVNLTYEYGETKEIEILDIEGSGLEIGSKEDDALCKAIEDAIKEMY